MLENFMQITLTVIQFLQTQMGWLAPVMKLFTFLGNEEFYILIMPVLVWSVDYGAGLRLGVMLMVSGLLNTFLKVAIHQPRPYWVSSKIQNMIAPMGSFGLPSGHSQNAAAVFGLVAHDSKRKWFKALMIFTIVMIAFSRLYLGVHSIADILLGLLVGMVLLWVFLHVEKQVEAFFARQHPWIKITLIFAISLALLMAGILIVRVNEGPLSQVWIDNAYKVHPEEILAPFSIDGLITSAATLFGLGAGGVWMAAQGGYNAKNGKTWQHVLRFVIGIVGVLFLWKGLGSVFPRNDDFLSFSLRYLRYALIGLWITGLAPMIFLKLNIAGKQ